MIDLDGTSRLLVGDVQHGDDVIDHIDVRGLKSPHHLGLTAVIFPDVPKRVRRHPIKLDVHAVGLVGARHLPDQLDLAAAVFASLIVDALQLLHAWSHAYLGQADPGLIVASSWTKHMGTSRDISK